MTREFITTFFFFFLLASVTCEENLTVVLYRVFPTRAEIDWYVAPSPLVPYRLSSCELVYGPVVRPEQVQVLPDVVPDRQLIELFDLDRNVTYRFQMICYDLQQRKYVSNRLIFTTGMTPSRSVKPSQKGDSSDSIEPNRRSNDSEETSRDTKNNNVILGATCGIVGFLIINVTVVMAVRQYSHRRMRQRRMYALQDEDYNVFPEA